MTLTYATVEEFVDILGLKSDIPSWSVGDSPASQKEEVGTGDNSQVRDDSSLNINNYIPWQPYYPDYPTPIGSYWWKDEPNKTEQAFKITKALLDQKLIKLNTIKQFIDLMDKLVKII